MADPRGLLSDEDEERARMRQAGFGGLLSIGAGLMGYGADTRNAAPLMAGVQGFQDALRGAMVDRQAAERAKYMRAQTAQMEAKARAQQQFQDKIAGAPAGGAVAQGDATQPAIELNDQERQFILNLPDPNQQAEAYRTIMERKLLDRLPPQGYRAQPGGKLAFIPGGPADPNVIAEAAERRRAANAKAIPTTVANGIQENMTAMQKIDAAIGALDEQPKAIGGPGSWAAYFTGDTGAAVQARNDPEGVKARALVTDIGSLKMHDRSGAVVPEHELKRLRTFLPTVLDDATTAKEKLLNFRREYEMMLRGTMEYYSPENGFRPYTPGTKFLEGQEQGGSPPQQGAPNAPQSAPAAREGMTATNPQTGQRIIFRNGKWEPI